MKNSAIVITGFMGSGKTTVGQLVARKLNRLFLDLDELVQQMAGQSIPDLFAQGEAHFRRWEREALEKLDLRQPIVLATGGGTLVSAGNVGRAVGARVIVLDAPLEEVRSRIGVEGGRPLAPRLEALYQRRAAAYRRLPLHVSTVGRSPEEVAEEVIAVAARAQPLAPEEGERETLHVRLPEGSYPIHVQAGGAATIGELVAELQPGAVALLTDETIGSLWGETVRHDLLAAGLPATLIEIPAGESYKTLDTVATIYDRLLDAEIDRGGAIVALGGGVVGDMAGFVAATWMRGTRHFVQVPTTLLAMVDASVGGKTGVDHPRGKNLIGAFRQPDLVLIDPTFLTTLPPRERHGGLAEVIKHGIIADPLLFEEAGRAPITPALLARAVRVKVDIVGRDPFERGERAKLNLGHTFGHAYELLSAFTLSHGEAVSIGMVTAARLSEAMGLAEAGLAARIEATLQAAGLPLRWPGAPDGERVWQTMQSDKKKGAQGLRFVLPRAIGDVRITEPGEVDRALAIEIIEKQNRAS